MRDSFPFLRVLTLPIGAGPGDARVVIDGPNGRIDVFDSTGARILSLSSTPASFTVLPLGPKSISLQDDGTGTNPIIAFRWTGIAATPGRIDMLTFGSYDSALRIAAPTGTGADEALLILASEDTSAGLVPTFRVRDENGGTPVDILRVDGGATSDVLIDDLSSVIPALSIPRGIVDQQSLTGSNGPHSADGDTDMTLTNQPVVAGRTYAIHAHSQIDLNNGPGDWLIRLRLNGADFSDLCRVQTLGTDLTIMMDATVYWTPAATQATDDLVIRADEMSGASDITLNGNATQVRTLTLTDVGRL